MKKSTRIEGLPGVFRARKCRVMSLFLTLSLIFVFSPVSAKEGTRTGKDVVDAICADCHTTGVDGAPKIGDPDAWSSRAAQGLSSLTRHALEGVRKMPAHGGHPELTDLEIARAITYMVNQSGGNWVAPASAAELAVERSGEDVVKTQCVKCHGEGVDGAPKIGDTNAWVQRIKQGLPNLVGSAIQGHGGMPPRGGEADLTDNELRAAILYMYNPAGEAGKTVSGAAVPQAQRSGEEVVKAQCVKCHGEGVGGAPKIGDRNAWVQRMKQGLPYLVRSAIRGHGGMPPRGGQANLTDDELKAAILYMYNPASASGKPAPGTTKAVSKAGSQPNHKFVGGLEIYLGFITADKLRALPKDAPERSMHGGIPKGAGYYHINVTLFDEKSGAPITDAKVEANLDWPGMSSTAIKLEPMLIGSGSYGNYLKPHPGTSYQITLRITRAAHLPVESKFAHTFD